MKRFALILILILALSLLLSACTEVKSIVSIEKTGSENGVDAYTITYSDGDTYVFYIYNGRDGIDAVTPEITIGENGNWFINGVDTGKPSVAEAPEITIGENGNWFIDGTDTGKTAVGKDAEAPEITIGENGNWFIDGTDTGKTAVGKDAEAPEITIGENGNWFIDGTDTGKTAVGKDAEAPEITIGENGNWFIDGTDTGNPSRGENGKTPEITIGENGNWFIDGIDTGHSASGGSSSPEEPKETVIMITKDDAVAGGYNYGSPDNKSTRLRVDRLIPVTAGTVIEYNAGSISIMLNVVSGPEATDYLQKGSWVKGTGTHNVTVDGYLAILGCNATDNKAAITLAEWDAEIKITIPPEKTPTEKPEATEALYSERLIYEFGGEGNDWCFVYLPKGYDPSRAEKYPFVIMNHGNGWTMDGTARRANYTDITMYMSAAEIANQSEGKRSRFIATDEEWKWYTNDTILEYLEAGYIVCGAQNYGDTLYGNANCRDACVDFYYHILETYNASEKCFMIGASNGAMTTLNAVSVLGERVAGIILQYPLTSLAEHYFRGNSGHRAGIRAAYGIIDENITEDAFRTATLGFDPLYTNVENGKKVGYFPPTLIYYSSTDGTTPAEQNALKLYNLLAASGIDVTIYQVDGDGETRGHGHVDHFNPTEFLAWSEAKREQNDE